MDPLDRLLKSFGKLDGVAQAGIFADESNATKALFAEMGTVTSPARPFMSKAAVTYAVAATRAVAAAVGATVDAAANGELATDPAKDGADVIAQGMQRTIDEGMPPPNAPSTIAKKGHARTLIDTGDMRNAIHARSGGF